MTIDSSALFSGIHRAGLADGLIGFEIWSRRNWQRVKNRVPYSALFGECGPPDIPA